MRKTEDYEKYIGKKYGKLTIKKITREKGKKAIAECECECGGKKRTQFTNIKYGRTFSCGCMEEKNRKNFKGIIKHNMSDKRIYHIWVGMKQRCFNRNVPCYKNYGGRGITICDEWQKDFMNFYNWAMANGYKENEDNKREISLDRIDNNGNYEPNNCRFANNQVQAYNKRTNFFNLEEHNRIIEKGFAPATIKQRMQKHNLTLEEALDIPLHTHIHIVK